MEQCFEHQIIKQHTALIPGLVSKVEEIHDALIGTLDTPGWLGRVAALEKEAAAKNDVEILKGKMGVVTRVAWGLVTFVGLGVGTALWALVVK